MKPCYIAKHPLVASRELGGEMIIMSGINSTLFTLNEVASLIWKFADGLTSLQEIVESKVCAEFDVDPSVAFADAEHLVNELATHRLIVVANHPIEDASLVERSS
jgi:Coenzyme PQQ synthesis protein D (PqqD)